MSAEPRNSAKTVGALVAALKVIRVLSRAEGPMGVTYIARQAGISVSTCFNILHTLVDERLVEIDPAKKSYAIGLGLLELTRGLTEDDRWIDFIRPRMHDLAQAHQVTCVLWHRAGKDRAVMVHRADTKAAIRAHMHIGQRLPMFVGAFGRVFAAFSGQSRAEIKQSFDTLRWENPPEFEAYWRDLQETARLGYALDRDNFARGVTSVAAPILDRDQGAIMVISAMGFSGQFTPDSLEAITTDLMRTTSDISNALSGIARKQ